MYLVHQIHWHIPDRFDSLSDAIDFVVTNCRPIDGIIIEEVRG